LHASLSFPPPHPAPACSSINNTFNIQGVKDHTMFFKTVEDAARLRLRISECFERAALPQTTPEVGGTWLLRAAWGSYLLGAVWGQMSHACRAGTAAS
jgi:hypothetical protein